MSWAISWIWSTVGEPAGVTAKSTSVDHPGIFSKLANRVMVSGVGLAHS